MTTPRELITGALRLINVVQANENPTAADMDISFEALNSMLDSWSTEELSIFTMNPYEFQFAAGQKEYTLGAGGDWDTARPMELQRMYVMYLDGGGDCPIPPAPPILYTRYGSFSARNGFDGDVGIAGYIAESNPFYSPFSVSLGNDQTVPDTASSYQFLTSAFLSGDFNCGGGLDTDAAGLVGPLPLGSVRSGTLTATNTYYNRTFWVPMRTGDQIWVHGTNFLGYGDYFQVDVVVGPDVTSGEYYVCTGNSVNDYDAFISIERLAWAGDR